MPGDASGLLREARIRANLRQVELAQRSNVAQSLISAYETGQRQPTLPTLRRLIAAAGFSLRLELQEDPARTRAFRGPVGEKLIARRRRLRGLLRERGIRDARVFGSVARGEDRPDSDIDLLVTLPDGVGVLALAALERELAELVGAPVDLVPEGGLKPHIREAIEGDLLPL